MSNPKPPTSGTPHSTLEHNPLIISTRPACDAAHWIPHVNQQATMRAVNFILLGTAAVFDTGAITSGTGLSQPPASWLHQCVGHRAAVVPISLDRLVTGRASSQRYPSDLEGVACPPQWLPMFLAGTPSPLPPPSSPPLPPPLCKARVRVRVRVYG